MLVRIVAVIAGIAVVGGANAAAAIERQEEMRPTLRIVRTAPLTLRGANFKARERVRVTVVSGDHRAAPLVRATSSGAFTVVVRDVTFHPCDFEARAVGRAGSRAEAKVPQRLCPPSLDSPTP